MGHDFGRVRIFASPGTVREVAECGAGDAGGPLPFAAEIQRSFGRHDIGAVTSHQGPRAAAAANLIRASAYTTGEHVTFGGAPDLHTAAHEAAHVLQQRAGVRIDGYMGKPGDAYERHADAVAGLVVAGRSAEPLLDQLVVPGLHTGTQRGVLQCKPIATKPIPPTDFGTFKVTKFESMGPDGAEDGIDINLEFDPDKSKVDATKIGFIQAAHSEVGGVAIAMEPSIKSRMVPTGTGKGFAIDRTTRDQIGNPVFGTKPSKPGDKPGDAEMTGAGQWGFSFSDKSSQQHEVAILRDRAHLPDRGIDSGQLFESAVVAVAGKQAGTYMGSVTWGWAVDHGGAFKPVLPTLKSKNKPSAEFKAAAQIWNKALTKGVIKTTASPTDIYSGTLWKVKYTVDKGTEVDPIPGVVIHDNIAFYDVKIKSGPHANAVGTVRATDVEDVGGGSALMQAPIP
jgi:hypothetical protein